MKYSNEEAAVEIMKRSKKLIQRKQRRVHTAFACSFMLLLTAIVTSIVGVSSRSVSDTTETLYGSFLLSQQAGGYVLVAILAFICGMILAAWLMYFRNHQKQDEDDKGEEK